MDADWTVACGADDPRLVLPWITVDGLLHYVDLRAEPSGLAKIPEAAQYPAIAAALCRWNQPNSPIFTAKCDVWHYPADLFDAEDLPGFAHAQGSYIDLLPSDGTVFSNFAACERQLRRWTESARRIEMEECRCEWTLRPSRILSMPASAICSSAADDYVDGFATTLYVWGYGPSPLAADKAWAAAVVALIEPVLASAAD